MHRFFEAPARRSDAHREMSGKCESTSRRGQEQVEYQQLQAGEGKNKERINNSRTSNCHGTSVGSDTRASACGGRSRPTLEEQRQQRRELVHKAMDKK